MLFPAVADHLAEGNDAGAGQQHHGVELHKIGEDRGVLQRGAGVGTQEAAAVSSQVLNDLQCSNGTHGDGLEGTLQRLDHYIAVKVLGHALPNQQQSAYDGEGDQDTGSDPD